MHIREKYSDDILENFDKRNFAINAERDHSRDDTNWADTVGKGIAQRAEDDRKSTDFDLADNCESANEGYLDQLLKTGEPGKGNGYIDEFLRQIEKYDDSGAHTYPGN